MDAKDINGGEAVDQNGSNDEKESAMEIVNDNIEKDTDEKKDQEVAAPELDTSSSSTGQPTPKRRKLDKSEKEAERLKREEEKRQREQERLEKLRVKEEEKRRKEEERVKREEEKKRKDEEKEQERLKREEEKRQRDEEKKRKDEEKEQERLKREEEKKQREEEKKQRDEEKKRKDEEREQERLKREEEKKKRDEEKRKKDEERQKRELEKKQLQEKLEEKKQKQVEFMSKFLQITPPPRKSITTNNNATGTSATESPPTNPDTESKDGSANPSTKTPIEVIDLENIENENPKEITGKCLFGRPNAGAPSKGKSIIVSFNPMPFQVKNDMALAPILRRHLTAEEKMNLDQVLTAEVDQKMNIDEAEHGNKIKDPQCSFLTELSTRPRRKSSGTIVKHGNAVPIPDDDIVILNEKGETEVPTDNPPLLDFHFKLLQFHENRRPAYWGTWKTKPRKVAARRPLTQEEGVDYEFDSDDEWEEEPEDGEDLKSENQSDDESNPVKNEEEEDEDDEGWMVPHGYLSDDERADAEVAVDNVSKIAAIGETDNKICDKDALKKQEEQYYKEIKLEKKLGLPYIQTDNLSSYRMILFVKKKERLVAKRNASKKFYEKLSKVKDGVMTFEGCLLSSDEEDNDWADSESSSESEDLEYASEEDEELKEEKVKLMGTEAMDVS